MFKKMISYVLAFTFVIGSVAMVGSTKESAAAATSDVPFTDIQTHWAKDNIIKAKNSGLIDGFPDGTFRPDSVVSADQFVSMMLRAFSNGETAFAQDWLDELFYIQPDDVGTIKSAAKRLGFNFQPASSGYWAKPYIDMLYEMDLLMTFDDVYPKKYDLYKKQITREKASFLLGTWLFNYEESYDTLYSDYVIANTGMKDFKTFTNGVVSNYRGIVLMAGVMNGYPNNYFYPHRYVTRAEALTMVQRLRDKTLRKPFKPNLNGKYYSDVDDRITLFSDKTKYDYYTKFVKLAKEHVTTGYVNVTGSGIGIWDSKETRDKSDFLVRLGDAASAPPYEFSIAVTNDTTRRVGILYPVIQKTKHSIAFQDAIFDLLVGSGKGKELKAKLDAYEKTGKLVNFTLYNKKFEFYASGKYYDLEMTY